MTIALCALLLASACTDGSEPGPAATGGRTPTSSGEVATGFAARTACSVNPTWLLRIRRGYSPERSADIQILPKVPNFVGSGLPHVGPWDFTSHVPLFWYGPGYIKPVGPVQEPVTLADVAATQAQLLGSDFRAPDGAPMLDALVPAEERSGPPRLVVVLIWDGTGRNVLDQWPDAWPNLEGLRSQGAWYEHATVGSSPTSSAQIHATIGTGAFPQHHLMVGHSIRVGGEIVSPWKDGPDLLELPTFGDHWDQQRGNEPIVALAGSVAIQLGMMSHGAYLEGGDRDLAILRVPSKALTLGAEGETWNLPEDYGQWYEAPPYANDLPPLPTYFDDVDLDAGDGKRDGLWHGREFEDSDELLGGFHTPARVPYQARLVEEMIRREGLGADDVPDLLYINNKLVDTLGHLYGIQDPAMADAVRTQDQDLVRFIDFLNETVGREQWVLLLTADHGSLLSAEASGAFQIGAEELHAGIQATFDGDGDDVAVVQQVKQTEIFINVGELEEQGHSLEDVSRYIMDLRQEDVAIPGLPVPKPNERVFQVAFPAHVLSERLTCLPEGSG
ncbi:MAG TPA: alkaline phosphatase family protein [Actinomycetota bacterium]|nr:alkaline phosphatase family protein [Actinomycetota bacterium]